MVQRNSICSTNVVLNSIERMGMSTGVSPPWIGAVNRSLTIVAIDVAAKSLRMELRIHLMHGATDPNLMMNEPGLLTEFGDPINPGLRTWGWLGSNKVSFMTFTVSGTSCSFGVAKGIWTDPGIPYLGSQVTRKRAGALQGNFASSAR